VQIYRSGIDVLKKQGKVCSVFERTLRLHHKNEHKKGFSWMQKYVRQRNEDT